jgi:hypothetical protein
MYSGATEHDLRRLVITNIQILNVEWTVKRTKFGGGGSAVIDFSVSWIKEHSRMRVSALLAPLPSTHIS